MSLIFHLQNYMPPLTRAKQPHELFIENTDWQTCVERRTFPTHNDAYVQNNRIAYILFKDPFVFDVENTIMLG